MQSVRSNDGCNKKAVTPTLACRIPIFAPTRRPKGVYEWQIITPWGTAIVSGRLGQQHRDLLDALRVIAIDKQWTIDGRLHVKFDLVKLRSALGGDAVNNRLIKNWIEDLRKARVEVRTPDGRVIVGGIISEYELSSDPTVIRSRPGAYEGERRYMRISFGTGWSQLIKTGHQTCYPLAKVVGLRYGFSQAVARFCLSHQEVRDTVQGLMQKVGGGGEIRKRRHELNLDAPGLLALGILVDGDAVTKVNR